MANEFIIKNGFHSKGDSQITGSLLISGSLQLDYNGNNNIIKNPNDFQDSIERWFND